MIIKSIKDGGVLYRDDFKSYKRTIEQATKDNVNLAYADLRKIDLGMQTWRVEISSMPVFGEVICPIVMPQRLIFTMLIFVFAVLNAVVLPIAS